MKKILTRLIITVMLYVSPAALLAQPGLKSIATADPKKTQENIIRTVNDLKTGNWQDVLSSFFQLSVSDLTGEKKALNFKANLFALKLKADSNLLLDYNYVKQNFARNFQFDFSLKLDNQYNFTGFQTGFTWAIVNKRDSTLLSFANTIIDEYYSRVIKDLMNARMKFIVSLEDEKGALSAEDEKLINEVKEKVDRALDQGYVPIEQYPKEFRPFLSEMYNRNLAIADNLFKAAYDKAKLKPLLTLSVNSNFENNKRVFNNGAAQLIYLQGFKTKRSKTEFDIRSSVIIKDTMVVTTNRRAAFNSNAGINFSLMESKTGKSIIEFKPYLEYNILLTDPYTGEKKNKFLANADLRIRIWENLWLPLTIKYDIEEGNFLGFLDVAINFSAFKNKK